MFTVKTLIATAIATAMMSPTAFAKAAPRAMAKAPTRQLQVAPAAPSKAPGVTQEGKSANAGKVPKPEAKKQPKQQHGNQVSKAKHPKTGQRSIKRASRRPNTKGRVAKNSAKKKSNRKTSHAGRAHGRRSKRA